MRTGGSHRLRGPGRALAEDHELRSVRLRHGRHPRRRRSPRRPDGGLDPWDAPPTPRLKAFIEALEKRYPSLDDDPDDSPWADWPLGDTILDGHGVSLSVVWSQADRMSQELRSACNQAGLTLYDPQESLVIRPTRPDTSPPKVARRWWKRRNR
jgi:hypothetical protein